MSKAIIGTKVLKTLINGLTSVSSKGRAMFDADGLIIKAVDESHVSTASLDIRRTSFGYYDFSQTAMGLDLKRISDALDVIDSDSVSIDYDDAKGRLVLSSDTLKRSMSVIDPSVIPDIKIPTMNMDSHTSFDSAQLKKILRVSSSISNRVKVILSTDGILSFVSENDSGENVELTLTRQEQTNTVIHSENASATYPQQYLSSILKAIPSDKITIALSTDYPIRITYGTDGSKIEYLLAPMID